MSARPRRFFVETWGCQMNELDSRRLAGQLVSHGMVPTDDPAAADVILLKFNDTYGAQSALAAVRALTELDKAWVDGVAVASVGGRVAEDLP